MHDDLNVPATHPLRTLWDQHHARQRYPRGVIAVPEPIPGLGFFPGGYGLFAAKKGQRLPKLPEGGVMVLGHDFHSEEGYKRSLRDGAEPDSSPTWRNLLDLLRKAGIKESDCFFTNLYMGLRKGSKTTGTFPGAGDEEFVAYCQGFLLDQIRMQRPRLIITLGIHVPPLIGALSKDLSSWTEKRGIKHLDKVGALKAPVRFDAIDGFGTTVVALLHPSLRHASLRHRSYKGAGNGDPELALLRDARDAALRD